MRENYTTGTIWEDQVGYCRAVKKGKYIEIAGTTATRNGEIVSKGDAAGQTKVILEIIKETLEHFNSGLKDVVRTRIFIKDIKDWETVTEVHGESFKQIKPVTTLIGSVAFVSDDMLVEIEATAILD